MNKNELNSQNRVKRCIRVCKYFQILETNPNFWIVTHEKFVPFTMRHRTRVCLHLTLKPTWNISIISRRIISLSGFSNAPTSPTPRLSKNKDFYSEADCTSQNLYDNKGCLDISVKLNATLTSCNMKKILTSLNFSLFFFLYLNDVIWFSIAWRSHPESDVAKRKKRMLFLDLSQRYMTVSNLTRL